MPATAAQQFQLQSRPQAERAEVVSVHDGDTLTVRQNWQTFKVRLCGIDAPELSQPRGAESKAQLQALLPPGQMVSLFISDTDRYGRKVAEVYISAHSQQTGAEKEVNYEQVVTGNAYVYPRYVDGCPNGFLLVQGEAIAQQSRVGVWQRSGLVEPWEYRRQQRKKGNY
ncbi:hypothetical protein BST81_02240 [Leptolyngbya sp. 'hensonii']|nr:hypothetical protein BST81_02240 [Leptolyngbya sp. 'hensonii']